LDSEWLDLKLNPKSRSGGRVVTTGHFWNLVPSVLRARTRTNPSFGKPGERADDESGPQLRIGVREGTAMARPLRLGQGFRGHSSYDVVACTPIGIGVQIRHQAKQNRPKSIQCQGIDVPAAALQDEGYIELTSCGCLLSNPPH
jgi:hypothetical protein